MKRIMITHDNKIHIDDYQHIKPTIQQEMFLKCNKKKMSDTARECVKMIKEKSK